jgi:hypothetical protein
VASTAATVAAATATANRERGRRERQCGRQDGQHGYHSYTIPIHLHFLSTQKIDGRAR